MNAKAGPLLMALMLATAAQSQDVVAKTTVADKSVILFDDGGWAYGPEEKSWCATLDAGLDLCLPPTWARIPNPDAKSHTILFRADGLLAEVSQSEPLPKLSESAQKLPGAERLLSDAMLLANNAVVVPGGTCAACASTVSVLADWDGYQTLNTVSSLPLSLVSISVTSTEPKFSADDLKTSEALVAGITLNLPVYEKAFGDGD